MNNRNNGKAAQATGRSTSTTQDSLLGDLLDKVAEPEVFAGYAEAMALAMYVRGRFGVTPYQKEAKYDPLLKFYVKHGSGDDAKVAGNIQVIVMYPDGKEYKYVRFLVKVTKKGITETFLPLTLDQTLQLIQDIANPYAYAHRLSKVEVDESAETES